jgi:pseudouridine kinase
VAAGLTNLGIGVELFSIVGDDPTGDQLMTSLASSSIGASGVQRSDSSPTARYTAVLDQNGDLEFGLADMKIFSELGDRWCDAHLHSMASHRVCLVDANLPAATLRRLIKGMNSRAMMLVDPVSAAKASRLNGTLEAIDVVFPDRQEAAVLSGLPTGSSKQVETAARRLLELGAKRIVVSLGQEGVCVADSGGVEHRPAFPCKAIGDVTGAGDGLLAGYVYGLLEEGAKDPVDYGLAAASLVLESEGASVRELTPQRLAERLGGGR